ncbi:hypothetical protein O3G_MSEX008356 [Manduca sexta]|uniref:Uncharacterized protein n=1 Tax=Manduca sexta TaxID=7130 RepID=A0A921ZAA0_MANSE|nr:hypothetical protein O3G_MSEX008356 [Manduca sexta]KAG6453856.1 hypothetical protein O3G_MSEX008356 [Manduca sexta]
MGHKLSITSTNKCHIKDTLELHRFTDYVHELTGMTRHWIEKCYLFANSKPKSP